MITASEAYKRTSEICDLITKEKLEEFKKEADEAIAKAISLGYWICSIPCDVRAKTLAYYWLKAYGYQVRFDFDSIVVDWSECKPRESSLRGE